MSVIDSINGLNVYQTGLYNKYLEASEKIGGNTGAKDVKANANGSIEVTEEDGDVFVVSQNGQITYTKGAQETEKKDDATVDTTNKTASQLRAEIAALQKELETKKAEKAENDKQIAAVQKEVETLKEQIQKEIEEAVAKSEQIAEESQEEVNKIVAQELSAYTQGKGEISLKDFKNNVATKIGALSISNASEVAGITAKLINTNAKMSTLEAKTNQLNGLIEKGNAIDAEISSMTTQISSLETAASAKEAEEAEQKKKSDPIGFTQNGNRYDFMIDKDGNGKLSNENEFLGAQNNWNEMAALDTDHDGKVTRNELDGANVDVVVTDKTGKQSVKDVTEVMGENDAIDLSSYKNANKDIGNGNTLLGTFGMTVNGQNVNGYNTLDDINWLNQNYQFSDKAGSGYNSASLTSATKVKADISDLKANMQLSWVTLSQKQDEVKEAMNTAKAQTTAQGANLENLFEQIKKQKLELQAEQKVNAEIKEGGKTEEGKTKEERKKEILEELNV